MKAAILTGSNSWRVDDLPDPELGTGDVLVHTEISAICGSDIHAAHDAESVQPAGFPGHESVGTVIDSRSPDFVVGQRVLCAPPAAVARGFTEHQVIPAQSVLHLPGSATADVVIAQQLGTAVFAMKRFWPDSMGSGAGRTAAVLGTGPAGLAFTRLLLAAGFELVVVSDTSPVRLAAAAGLGAQTLVHAPQEDALEVAMQRTDGKGVDLVIEAAGKDVTRHQAMRMVAYDGRIGLFGLEEQAGMSPWPLAEVFRRRPTIDMVWNAQAEPGLSSFRSAIEMTIARPAPEMISHRFGIEDIGEAFALAADPSRGAVKVAITFA
jgi:L-iditol 2-dehydrogenase